MIDLSSYAKLSQTFYENPEVVELAKDLVGKYLISNVGNELTIGRIVETEAYNGRSDRACHAFKRRTPRTETLYGPAGHAYVYLCYGIHHMFNVVANLEGLADAVLIRSLEPVWGADVMQQRRGARVPYHKLAAGPGSLCQAMGIRTSHNAISLQGELIWIAENKKQDKLVVIETDTRIGVAYAGEDALLPWRFFQKDCKFVSVKKQNPRT